MMRSLAEFIMKGRLQAALVALLGIPLLSTAAVGMVTLRLGHREGVLVLIAAFIPTLIGVAMGRMPELLFWLSLISIMSVYLYAILLRSTVSWAFTLLTICGLLLVLTPILTWRFDGLLASFSLVLSPEVLSGQAMPEAVTNRSVAMISGLVALLILLNGFTSIVLSRWWQSLLYNPGGFGEEFRVIRFDKLPTIVLLLLAGFCFANGSDYVFWAMVFVSPLVIAALSLAHYVAKVKGLGASWLASLYLLTVFFLLPVAAVLALIGSLDAIFNFRQRFQS